ncbi:MAG: response regulator transcription factor, partial [Synechococcales cyanobacterium RU_4_20]|nr:response regulator transcription factor [Synechococcales cyanobacterium RU_4_20]
MLIYGEQNFPHSVGFMADRPIYLVLIDSDSIFRLGLQTALQAQTPVGTVEVQPSLAIGLAKLQRIALEQGSPSPGQTPLALPDLVLVNLGSLVEDEGLAAVERSLRQFRQTLPELPMLALEYTQPPRLGLWAQRMNLSGYWAKGRSVPELVVVIKQVLRGQQVWTLAQADAIAPTSGHRAMGRGVLSRRFGQNPWSRTLNSGIQQIETQLRTLEHQRQSAQTPWIDQVWLAGWQRELHTTRWLLGRLGAASVATGEADSIWELENSSSVPLRSALEPGERER